MFARITFLTLLLIVGSCLARSTLQKTSCPKPVSPSADYDVDKFAGFWYEIERSFEPFELEWDCASFNYTRKAELLFKVDMNGIHDKKPVVHHGQAVYNASTPYVLTLTFGKFDTPDDQWIVDFNEEKGYALVLTCFETPLPINIEFIWIFSRTKTLDKAIIADLKKKLDNMGISSELLKPVPQTCLSQLE